MTNTPINLTINTDKYLDEIPFHHHNYKMVVKSEFQFSGLGKRIHWFPLKKIPCGCFK